MMNRRWKNLCGVVAPALLLAMPFALSGCGDDDLLAREPSVIVNLQETTATITATWRYSAVGSGSWTMADEWRSSRVSGGDNWSVTGVSADRSATFTVPRAVGSAATGAFCVVPVRVDPQPGRFTERCADFVVPAQTIPDAEIDSLTINVTDASGVHRRLADESGVGVDIKYTVPEGSTDTTWRYSAHLADGTVLEDLVVQTGLEHTGIQLTALAWLNGEVVACSGDCAMYPATMRYNHPWGAPIFQAFAEQTLAYNPFPPAVDVLGR